MKSFLEHPSKVCMTYASHFRFSLGLSALFFKASVQALIHAVFPFWCIHNSSEHCRHILRRIQNNGCRDKVD